MELALVAENIKCEIFNLNSIMKVSLFTLEHVTLISRSYYGQLLFDKFFCVSEIFI